MSGRKRVTANHIDPHILNRPSVSRRSRAAEFSHDRTVLINERARDLGATDINADREPRVLPFVSREKLAQYIALKKSGSARLTPTKV